jgi:hypothetical protein
MRAGDLDFAAREAATPRLAWIALGLGALLFALAADRYTTAIEANEQLAGDLARIERRARHADRQAGETPAAPAAQLAAFPWPRALGALEAARNADIALLSLDTDAGQRRSRVGGEARNIDAALAFVSRLHAAPPVAGAVLVAHESLGGGERPRVAFTVQIEWRAE